MGLLVAIIGIDGSGKTTLAAQLTKKLMDRGVETKYLYGRFKPRLTKPFSRWFDSTVLKDSKKDPRLMNTELNALKSRMIKKWGVLHLIYFLILILDYSFFLLINVRTSMRDRVVICDRYIQDTLVNELFFHLDYLDKRTLQQLTRSWIKRMPAPDLTVHLDVPAHIAIKRKSDIPSERYITEKKALYRAINQTILLSVPGYERILPISGAQTVGDITEIVYSDIITLLGDR